MAGELSPHQVEALKSVDLRLGWVVHGHAASDYEIPARNGPSVVGLSETDYSIPARLLSDMGSGDVSARESLGGQAPMTNSEIVDYSSRLLHYSPYSNNSGIREVPGYEREDVEDPLQLPGMQSALARSAEEIRQLQLTYPFIYLDGLAAAKGIDRAVADSPQSVYEQGMAVNRELRNAHMVSGLGSIALGMRDKSENPGSKLAFTAGYNHQEGVEDLLTQHNIPFESHVTDTPMPSLEEEIALSKTFASREAEDEYYAQKDADAWFSNLRKQGHVPIQLRSPRL